MNDYMFGGFTQERRKQLQVAFFDLGTGNCINYGLYMYSLDYFTQVYLRDNHPNAQDIGQGRYLLSTLDGNMEGVYTMCVEV